MGILPASLNEVTDGGAPPEPDQGALVRILAFIAAVVAYVVALALTDASASSLVAQASQFSLLMVVGPMCIVVARPWKMFGPWLVESLERSEAKRRMRTSYRTVLIPLACTVGATIVWRTPAVVNVFVHHSAVMTAIELCCGLLTTGWLASELTPSRPLNPTLSPLQRIGFAAVPMWTVWLMAYLLGFSSSSFYVAYHHIAGNGLSRSASQQVATFILFLAAAVTYLPLCFSNLVTMFAEHDEGGVAAVSLSQH